MGHATLDLAYRAWRSSTTTLFRCTRDDASEARSVAGSEEWRSAKWRARLARRTMSPRSCALKLGRATDRAATMSCWRRSAFSAMSSSRDRNAPSTSPTKRDVGRVAARTAECTRRTTPATTPPTHRANTASTRGIVAIPENRSSLVRRAFPRDHAADASGSHDSSVWETTRLASPT